MQPLTEIKKAYIAGLIDGEGCVYLTKHLDNKKFAYRYRVRLQVTNTYYPILLLLKDTFGGGIYEYTHREDWKTRYDWVIADQRAVNILKELLPYLIIKREQALTAIAFREGSMEKESARIHLSSLNRKGAYAVQEPSTK